MTEIRHADADAELSRCIITLLLKEPFFGHLLGTISRRITHEVPTMAVAFHRGHLLLLVNPQFLMVDLPNRSQRVAVVKHEALHVVFKHVFRGSEPWRHRRVFMLACELVVNQFIGETWELPPSAVTLETFPDLDLEPDLTADEYYERLMQSAEHVEVVGALAQDHCCDASGWGHEAPSQVDNSTMPSAGAAVNAVRERGVDRLLGTVRARTGAHGWGQLPQQLRELLDDRTRNANHTVDWKRALRLFASSSRRTRICATMRRESRRFDTIPGIKVKRLQHLAIAVDTSGSVDAHQLSVVFAEIHAIWRAGAEVDVIECDAEVRRTWSYKGRPPTDIEGRGGTAFDPVFDELHARRSARYDACVYITDGWGPRPKRKPPCKLLWLLTHDGTAEYLDFGRVVRLPPP